MGHGEGIRLHPVLAHQQPAGKPPFESMNAIAGGRLRCLHQHSVNGPEHAPSQLARGLRAKIL